MLSRVRDLACTALAMEQAGVAAACLEMTVAYAKDEQFSRPIGDFQALKYRLTDLYVLLEIARWAAYAAAWGPRTPRPRTGRSPVTRSRTRPLAKVSCSEARFAVASEAVQMHGGIAITWEHDAQLYLKRAHGSAQLFGQPRLHVARTAGAFLD